MSQGEQKEPERDSQQDEAIYIRALALIADIRAAAGDPLGRLCQQELVEHIGEVRKALEDLLERPDVETAMAAKRVVDRINRISRERGDS